MSKQAETLGDRLERSLPEGDAIEGERLRNAVKARLLDVTAPETRIDRFVVIGQLGAGGMGIVYAAYDPELDRKVAIKLVRTWGSRQRGEDQERLVREARALAKLSHPNVVAVFEVGIHGDSVFIAMEFVRGRTLREHAVEMPWRSIVRAYVDAGEGLAAAHQAGLVHRDFKPDNVLVGDDGRVRVVDFGVARGEDGTERRRPSGEPRIPEGTPLTETGAMIGTPAYMAPEQRLGLPVGPQSDQFGFCASLHEALAGAAPRMDAEGVAAVALDGGLPARLRRAIARGLSALPQDRFADMRALLHELRVTIDTSRRTRVAVVAALVGVGTGAMIAAILGERDPCPDPTEELVDVWGEGARQRLRDAAAHQDGPALESAAIVERELDARGDAWVASRRAACEALFVHRTDSDSLFDRRMRCLARRRDATRDLVELLADGDAAVWQHAVEAVVGLERIEACDDTEALVAGATMPDDPARVGEIEAVHARIDHAQTLGRLARLGEAREIAALAVDEAARTQHRVTEAEALGVLAEIEDAEGHDVTEAGLLDEALWCAEAGRSDELAVEFLARALATASGRGRLTDAIAIERRLLGAVERLGRESPTEPHVWRARGSLAEARGRYAEAEALARAGIEASRRWNGERSLDVARQTNNLGIAQYEQGDYVAAGESFALALTGKLEWLPEVHPDVIATRANVASVLERQGRVDEAETMLEAALVDAESSLTGPSPLLSVALDNLAHLHIQTGRFAEALPIVERSIANVEGSVGGEDVRMLNTLVLLGIVQDGLGRRAEARLTYARLLVIADGVDPDHSLKAYAWNNLAAFDLLDHRFDDGRRLAERALALWIRTHGPDHPMTGQIAFSVASAQIESGAAAEAIASARQSIAVLERGGPADAASLAGARYVLARGLMIDRPEAGRVEALASARLALEWFEGAGNGPWAAEVRGWIEKHARE